MVEITQQLPNTSGNDLTTPPEVEAAKSLYGGFDKPGVDADPRTADGDFEATGPVFYWSDGSRKVGVFENEAYADDGYPYTVATWVVPFDGGRPYWRYKRIAQSWTAAIRGAEMVSDFQAFIRDSNKAELYSDWVDRTGGTDYEPGPFPWDEDEDEQ